MGKAIAMVGDSFLFFFTRKKSLVNFGCTSFLSSSIINLTRLDRGFLHRRKQKLNTRTNESIKIIPLGGVGEVGKNMYVVEIDHEMFIVDAGIKIPEDEMFGIDLVIPDITYLEEQKHRIKGIFLTHGHEDAIGALSYVLRKIKAPVYGTKLTVALAKEKLKEQEYRGEAKFYTLHSKTRLHFDTVDVSFFRTTHTIPDSVGVCFHTSEGAIVVTGDFKFDQGAAPLYQADIGKMAKIGEEGVLCLLSDSTEAERPGYSTSDAAIAREMSDAFHSAKGRIIVASYAANLNRIQQVLDAAYENYRKVAFVGKSIKRVFDIAHQLGYLSVHEDTIIPIQDIDQYPEDEIALLTTGSHGEPLEALQKMAKQSHKQVNIKQGDTVLITATPTPNMELAMYKTVDMLYRAGAMVIMNSRKAYASGHGSQEELKMMINLMKPKFFIPIQGEYRMLKAHAKLAQSVGVKKEHIFIPDKGEIVEIRNGTIRPGGRVPAGNVLIDGIGVGDVGNIVLRDRKLLSEDGIFIVVVTLNKKEKKIASGPEIISRGFVYVRESEHLMEESISLVKGIVERNMSKESFEWSNIKQEIRDSLNQYLFDQTKRRPMILPIIMEI
jgi:ribonuclease J